VQGGDLSSGTKTLEIREVLKIHDSVVNSITRLCDEHADGERGSTTFYEGKKTSMLRGKKPPFLRLPEQVRRLYRKSKN